MAGNANAVAPGRRAFAGAAGVGVAIEIGVADVGAGGAAGSAALGVGIRSLIQADTDIARQARALHVAAGVRQVRRSQRVGAVAAAEAAIASAGQVVRVQSAVCHDFLLNNRMMNLEQGRIEQFGAFRTAGLRAIIR